MARSPSTTPTATFDEALAELEQIVEKMESGKLSLEDSLTAFERGIALTRHCQTALSEAQQRVQMLVSEGGEPKLVDFAVAPDADQYDPENDDEDDDEAR